MSSGRTRRERLLEVINSMITLNEEQLSRIDGNRGWLSKWWHKYFNRGVADKSANGKKIYGKSHLIRNVKSGLETLRGEIQADQKDDNAANHLSKLKNLVNENAMVFEIKRYRTADIAVNTVSTLIIPTAIGTWICPVIGTAIGFMIGLAINLVAKNKGWILGGESDSMKAWRKLAAVTFIEKAEDETVSIPEVDLDAHEQAYFAERDIKNTFKNTLDGNFRSGDRVIEMFVLDENSLQQRPSNENKESSVANDIRLQSAYTASSQVSYGAVESVNPLITEQGIAHEHHVANGNCFFPKKIKTITELQQQMAADEKSRRQDGRRIHRLGYP